METARKTGTKPKICIKIERTFRAKHTVITGNICQNIWCQHSETSQYFCFPMMTINFHRGSRPHPASRCASAPQAAICWFRASFSPADSPSITQFRCLLDGNLERSLTPSVCVRCRNHRRGFGWRCSVCSRWDPHLPSHSARQPVFSRDRNSADLIRFYRRGC